jgi:PilZ domain
MPTVLPAPLPEEQAKSGAPERRVQTRFPFTASADVYELRSQTRVNGRCSDLSVGGCYVDTLSPLAVGAVVRIRLVRDSRAFESAAVVTYAHTSMGMGLAFTGMKREDQEVLRSWIADLSGEQPPELAVSLEAPAPARSAPPPAARETEAAEANASLQPIVYELITLLMRKNLITENEGALLLRRIFQ